MKFKIAIYLSIVLQINLAKAQCPAGYPSNDITTAPVTNQILIDSQSKYAVNQPTTINVAVIVDGWLYNRSVLNIPKLTVNHTSGLKLCMNSIINTDTLVLNEEDAIATDNSAFGIFACVSVKRYLEVNKTQVIPLNSRLCLGQNVISIGYAVQGQVQQACNSCMVYDKIPVISISDTIELLDLNRHVLYRGRLDKMVVPPNQILILKNGYHHEKIFKQTSR